ncbi:MAG: hypothetical protein RBU37_01275 [Myxococcota bacterium]|jgi:hypothetical protein|nr:hypothetical protein [Myxococcota bacterium]
MDAPTWQVLSQMQREELASVGICGARYAGCEAPLQLTFLCIHAQLKLLELWRFIAREDGSSQGCLHFRSKPGLRAWLQQHPTFHCSALGPRGWQARQRRLRFALHLKQFSGWPEDRVQAHIDPVGGHFPWWTWLLPGVPASLLLWHLWDFNGYLDVERIRRQCCSLPESEREAFVLKVARRHFD